MRDVISGLKMSFGYFSILPVWYSQNDRFDNKTQLKWMIWFLPVVGMVIASLAILPYYLIQNNFFAILSALLYLILSGFLHLEAVIDVVDAIYAKQGGKDAYSIIKEPTVGALGVLWGVAFLILEVVGFAFLLVAHRYIDIIIISAVARVGVLSTVYFCEFKSEFLNQLKQSMDKKGVLFWLVLSLPWIYMVAVYLMIAWFVGKVLEFKNGDVLGFSLEATVIIWLIGISASL
jgi:adenosylcobinamide-GDP ribazoletransferase